MKFESDIFTQNPEYSVILQSFQRKLQNYSDKNVAFSSVYKSLIVEMMESSPPFDFIDTLFPSSSDIFLVYTRFEKTSSTPFDLDTVKTQVFFDNDSTEEFKMDLIGQPLECPFNLSEIKASIKSELTEADTRFRKVSENKYEPLPISVARNILNVINGVILEYGCEESPIFCVLCDAKNRNQTWIIGSHLSSEGNLNPFAVDLVEGSISKGIPSLSQLKCDKSRLLPPLPNSQKSEKAFSTYNFTNGTSSVTVECNWYDESKELLCTPPRDANCNLRIKLVLGEAGGPLYALHKELSLLRNAVEAIETGEMIWPLEDSDNESNAVQKVKDMIKANSENQSRIIRKENFSCVNETKDSNSFCLERIFVSNQGRGDFTTDLWSAMQYCKSMNDLEEALHLYCNAVTNRELYPHIHPKNTTTLGIWLRKTFVGAPTEQLNFKDISALTMLVEIGIEKLWTDYCAAFFDLMPLESLNYYFQPHSAGLPLSVDSLFKIHYTLDLVVFIQYSLAMEYFDLTKLASQVLKETSKPDFSVHGELHLDVKVPAILPALIRSKPDRWGLNFKVTESKEFSWQIHCQFSQTRIVPENWCTTVATVDDTEKIETYCDTKAFDKLKYYGIIVQATETKFH